MTNLEKLVKYRNDRLTLLIILKELEQQINLLDYLNVELIAELRILTKQYKERLFNIDQLLKQDLINDTI